MSSVTPHGAAPGATAPARIPLDEWEHGGRTIHYREQNIFVRSGGATDGEALVLIHGFPTASWDWEALWPDLIGRYRVLTLDMIGFGFSAKPTDYTYSISDQATLFESVLRHEGVTAYHVLAHDYGDTVAQELLARQDASPARPKLRSVAFLNGGLFPETHRAALIQRLLLSPLGPWVAKRTTRARLASNMRRIFGPSTQPDDALIDDFWSLIARHDGAAVMHHLIRYIAERKHFRARWVGALQTARVPLTLIAGTSDPISGEHMIARYEELVRRPDVTRLEGIGHYPQIEASAAVLAAYRKFRERSGAT